MSVKITGILFWGLFLFSCQTQQSSVPMNFIPADVHSYAQPNVARVTHLSWKANVDFDSKTIHAIATWTIQSSGATEIILDTKSLSIAKVSVDGKEVEFTLGTEDAILGQALHIPIKDYTKTIAIEYTTSPKAEALQWLSPQQTSGNHPFLFTQSQAILARSWVPCQDSPGIRFTYTAEVTVPKDLLPLMSATNPQQKNEKGTYQFEMKQPISSYLLALSVGDVVFKPISERSGIYAEASVLDSAVWEFADLEKMIVGAEELYGAYAWERYDVLVLPPSFPFGGMENPRLTFATPTILAGDRSLTSLIAHELAHSWSGNLVTNATWNDFWLNEGFTVYFEHRIMEKLYGVDYAEMLATLALQDLQATIDQLTHDGLAEDTKLRLNLEGRNPDDGVTDIAYNKGYFFLRSIEERYGREKFDAFLNEYFLSNAFRAMDTDGFMQQINAFYKETFALELEESLFKEWIFTRGLPASCPSPKSTRFEGVDKELAVWNKTEFLQKESTVAWSTHEWIYFLNALPNKLSDTQMKSLDASGAFTQTLNAEIAAAWFLHAIRNEYTVAFPALEEFLIHTGRRKFLSPLYAELLKTPDGKTFAQQVYAKARPNYHFVATNTFDPLLKK
jgi:aminopeptidase N